MRSFRRVFMQDLQRAFSSRFIVATAMVVLLMLLENVWEIRTAVYQSGYTVYYFFFNTIVFSGLLGTYGAPVACALPYCGELLQERIDGIHEQFVARVGFKQYYLSKFLTATVSSGICLCMGYWLFIAVLLLFFPFSDVSVVNAGMSVFPYTEYSLAGCEWIHILIILYYGFLHGALYGALSTAASSFFKDKLVVFAMPFLIRFSWIQLYRLIPIKNEYRLDYWLLMRTSIRTDGTTMLVALLRVIAIIVIAALIYLRKCERRES